MSLIFYAYPRSRGQRILFLFSITLMILPFFVYPTRGHLTQKKPWTVFSGLVLLETANNSAQNCLPLRKYLNPKNCEGQL